MSLSVPVSAQSPEAMLMRGNEFYKAKNYNKAIEIYEGLIEQGFESSVLFYNTGNAYYRTGKLGFAILYYEKALKLSPSDEDIKHNLALANLQTADRIETLPKFFLFQWWEALLGLFSVSGWTYVSYIFYIIVLASVVLYFFVRRTDWQKKSVYAFLVSIVLLFLSISILIVKLNREENVKHGVIVENIVTAKSSPDNRSNDAFVIHEGLKVKVEDKVDNWLKIRLDDGKIGWLTQNTIKII